MFLKIPKSKQLIAEHQTNNDEFIAQIQILNILYDEDGSVCFLPFYGPCFGNGFFFEFVQRIRGYAGFGAPNAPFRLAA
ncbi:MAG: hypothetical protein ISQ26_09500 [Candidatus Puniceispirillum sp.]|nr:hypothetical protein [Candidatus Puniceispirillum sp.]